MSLVSILLVTACYQNQTVRRTGTVAESNEIQVEEFPVHVTRIEAKDRIPAGEPLVVRVWAQLGPNGCYRFDRFEVRWNHEVAIVDVIGIHKTGPIMCTMAPTKMRGVELVVYPPDLSVFELVFNQSDDKEIRHVVRADG